MHDIQKSLQQSVLTRCAVDSDVCVIKLCYSVQGFEVSTLQFNDFCVVPLGI